MHRRDGVRARASNIIRGDDLEKKRKNLEYLFYCGLGGGQSDPPQNQNAHAGFPVFAGFEKVNEAIVEMMPRLSYDWANILWKELNALGDVIQTRKDKLGSELSDMAPKRRAMQGYGHLRSHKRGQRIEKSV